MCAQAARLEDVHTILIGNDTKILIISYNSPDSKNTSTILKTSTKAYDYDVTQLSGLILQLPRPAQGAVA